MKFHNQIKTTLGDIWIADTSANNFVKIETESRQQFEAKSYKV